jgi:hypothetical protein
VTCPVCWQRSRRNHRQNNPLVKLSVKVNISPLTRPYPPLLSFFFLISTLPNCKQLAPPRKNLHLLSTTSHISWSLLVTTSVAVWRNFKPIYISEDIWLHYLEHVMFERFTQRSQSGVGNRNRPIHGSVITHTDGSVSFAAHEKRMVRLI